MMSQQHKRWNSLVEEAIEKRGWSRSDLATVVGVSPATITQLFKEGKGSDDLKLRINKKLRINESWEKFEEQKKRRNEPKIRKDGIYLNNQELKGAQAIKTKSTAESNHATVYLKFTAKLI